MSCRGGEGSRSGSPGWSHLGLPHFAAFVTILGYRLQPVRILAGPSGFPLSGGRSGRLNEVLDAGSRIPSALVAATGVGFAGISLLTDSQLFSGRQKRGFQEVLGPDREPSSRHVSWEDCGGAGV